MTSNESGFDSSTRSIDSEFSVPIKRTADVIPNCSICVRVESNHKVPELGDRLLLGKLIPTNLESCKLGVNYACSLCGIICVLRVCACEYMYIYYVTI